MHFLKRLFSRHIKKKLLEVIASDDLTLEERIGYLIKNTGILPKFNFDELEEELVLTVHSKDINDLAVLLKQAIVDVKAGTVHKTIKHVPSYTCTVGQFFSDRSNVLEWLPYDLKSCERILNETYLEYIELLKKGTDSDQRYFIRRHGQVLEDLLELITKLIK